MGFISLNIINAFRTMIFTLYNNKILTLICNIFDKNLVIKISKFFLKWRGIYIIPTQGAKRSEEVLCDGYLELCLYFRNIVAVIFRKMSFQWKFWKISVSRISRTYEGLRQNVAKHSNRYVRSIVLEKVLAWISPMRPFNKTR